jgi:hypothetical protein
MAWKTPAGGIGGFNAGFDQSGGDQLWQAKTVSPTDPDVYRKGSFFGLGSKLTPQGKDINRAVEDYRTWNRRYGSQLGEDDQLDIYKQNFQSNPREFYKKYPFSYDLGFTMDDLDEQGLLPEKAPEGYFDLAGGGIASLENRPGYAWGGSPHKEIFGTSGWAEEYPVTNKLWQTARDQQPTGRLLADTMRANIQPYPGGNMMDNWRASGRDFRDTHHFPNTYETVGDRMRGEGFLETESGKKIFPTQMNDWGLEEDENFQGGGAVGLEPGIGSLMGYAKGGMVTRVKIPKGQSKWMKKFMNNMRDN